MRTLMTFLSVFLAFAHLAAQSGTSSSVAAAAAKVDLRALANSVAPNGSTMQRT
jgi:hypothetical protein